MTEYYTLGNWDSYGVPKYLDSITAVSPTTMNRIISTLPEKSNIPVTQSDLIDSNNNRNILIKTNNESFNGADIYVTFLYEGAGYRNVLGYYFYPLNGDYTVPTKWDSSQNTWIPMTYYDRNNVDSNGKSILKKTIVFPNSSLPTWANSNGKNSMAGGGNLFPGSRVKLLYDISNPSVKFPNNTGIGFFVIPNGWNGITFYNANERIYTDNIFNTQNSVQTVVLFDAENSDENMGTSIISFEDIMRPGGDSDFNDLIIQVDYTPTYSIYNNNGIILSGSSPITKDGIIIDRSGMYLALTDTTFKNIITSSSINIKISHKISINNEDQCRLLFDNLSSFTMENLVNVTKLNDNDIECSFSVAKKDLHKYMYFFNSFININKTSSYNPNVSALVEFQSLYANNQHSIINQSLRVSDDLDKTYVQDNNFSPTIINFNSPYAMGDPHIMTIYGKKYDLPNLPNTYLFYSDSELSIIGKIDYIEQNFIYPEYRDLTFVKYVQLDLDKYSLLINLFHVDTYYDVSDGIITKISDHPLFIFNTKYPLYEQRTKFHTNYLNTNQFDLRYVKFETVQLGTIYIEIVYMSHRKDFINNFTILCDSLQFVPNPRGILVNYNTKYILESKPYMT